LQQAQDGLRVVDGGAGGRPGGQHAGVFVRQLLQQVGEAAQVLGWCAGGGPGSQIPSLIGRTRIAQGVQQHSYVQRVTEGDVGGSPFRCTGVVRVQAVHQSDKLARGSGLAVGGSLPLPEIFESAGIRFDFSLKMIEPLMEEVQKELQRLEALS